MNKDEDIFDELDDEIVSSEDVMEEQSNDVPSNSNRVNFSNNIKNMRDYEKNNKGTIERLNNAKNGNRSHIGRELGNKIAGRSEEEKSGLEKAGDEVAGKAAGAAITAATGGAVGGELANQLGDAAVQIAKKQISTKIKIYVFVAVAIISLIFIIILAMNSDDRDGNESTNVNSYVTGSMSEDELYFYLERIGICPDKEVIKDDIAVIEDIVQNNKEDLKANEEYDVNAVCKYAISYFKRIKKTYNDFNQACVGSITQQKDINKPCDIILNIPLLHESLSYGKATNELWSQKSTPNQKKDIEDLSNAMVEYVHESCYIYVKRYKDKNGNIVENNCDGCTYYDKVKRNQDWYYFQLTFDKYVSFLKYGNTSSHPYYTGENGGVVLFGENHDHECVGPTHSSLNTNYSSSNSSSSSSMSNNSSSSNYCSDNYCASYSGTAHTECVKGCKKIQDDCKNNTCKGISSSSDYQKCMNTCVK